MTVSEKNVFAGKYLNINLWCVKRVCLSRCVFAIRFWLPKSVHFTNVLHFVLTKRQTVQRSSLIYNYTNHHNVVVNGLLKSKTTTRILQSTLKRIILPITSDNMNDNIPRFMNKYTRYTFILGSDPAFVNNLKL